MIDNLYELFQYKRDSSSDKFRLSGKFGYYPLSYLYYHPTFIQNHNNLFSYYQKDVAYDANWVDKVKDILLKKSNNQRLKKLIWEVQAKHHSSKFDKSRDVKSNILQWIDFEQPCNLRFDSMGRVGEDTKKSFFLLKSDVYNCNQQFYGCGSFGYIDDYGNCEVFGTIVFKKEYLKYLKLAITLEEPIDYSQVFEFWIVRQFKNYRTLFKFWNGIKEYIESKKKIPIIEKDNINCILFDQIYQPKFKSIREKKDWLDSCKNEFLNTIRTDDKLEVKKFEYELPKVDQRIYELTD